MSRILAFVMTMSLPLFSAQGHADNAPIIASMQNCVSYQTAVGDTASRPERLKYCIGTLMLMYGSTKTVCNIGHLYAFSSESTDCDSMRDDVVVDIPGATQDARVDHLIHARRAVGFVDQCVQIEEAQEGAGAQWKHLVNKCVYSLLQLKPPYMSDKLLSDAQLLLDPTR